MCVNISHDLIIIFLFLFVMKLMFLLNLYVQIKSLLKLMFLLKPCVQTDETDVLIHVCSGHLARLSLKTNASTLSLSGAEFLPF
jgi:hypothetical protein